MSGTADFMSRDVGLYFVFVFGVFFLAGLWAAVSETWDYIRRRRAKTREAQIDEQVGHDSR